MKLIKIRFTAWRDHSAAPRTLAVQAQHDALTMREGTLIGSATRVRNERAHADNEVLQRSIERINDELQTIDAQRTFLLSGEEATAEAEAHAASIHERAGTSGYQVLDETGSVAMFVDKDGENLPIRAVFSFEVVDENPPLPAWAKKGKVGRFE